MPFPVPHALALLLAAGVALTTAGCSAGGPAGPDDPSAPVDLAALTGEVATPASSDEDPDRCTSAQRWAALAVVAPRVRDTLATHPDLAAEIDRTRDLPAAQRRGALRDYVAAHPGSAPDAAGARDAWRQYRATCSVS